ncbi:MAG: hypothetical protein ABIK12_10050, partial [Pseudomonadota bacterium]
MQKHYLELDLPSLKDNTADLDRLAKALRRAGGGWSMAPVGRAWEFAKVMRGAGYKITATHAHGVLLQVEEGDTTGQAPDPAWAGRTREVPPALWGSEGLG